LCLAQAPAQTFRGTIGEQSVVVKLQRDGDKLTGSYSYERIGQSITLKGQIDPQGNVTLAEFDSAGRQTGQFKGKLEPDEERTDAFILDGTWTRPDGSHETSFDLHEQQLAFTNGLQFTSKTIADRRLNIKAIFPQLAGGDTPGVLAFNRAVEILLTRLVNDYRKNFVPTDHGGGFETDYNVLLATDDLVSVELNEEYRGGAHPEAGHDAVTYDLHTGHVVTLASLFKSGTKYADVLRRAARADMVARLKRVGAEENQPTDESIFSDEDLKEWHAWGLTPRGLVLYFELPHVIAVFDKAFIPWTELKDMLDPKGPAAQFARTNGAR
ncbi:MAG TPA: hypothetical protein VE821_07055, partial [Pyrinomonadaceae bacterium]|nr:hypothetical protein [Pyrinomonadaceae bacterium]